MESTTILDEIHFHFIYTKECTIFRWWACIQWYASCSSFNALLAYMQPKYTSNTKVYPQEAAIFMFLLTSSTDLLKLHPLHFVLTFPVFSRGSYFSIILIMLIRNREWRKHFTAIFAFRDEKTLYIQLIYILHIVYTCTKEIMCEKIPVKRLCSTYFGQPWLVLSCFWLAKFEARALINCSHRKDVLWC